MRTNLFFAPVAGGRVERLWRDGATIHLEVVAPGAALGARPALPTPLPAPAFPVHAHAGRPSLRGGPGRPPSPRPPVCAPRALVGAHSPRRTAPAPPRALPPPHHTPACPG